jgi:outer membrane protein assembly factor BamD (BamD/ComL family)
MKKAVLIFSLAILSLAAFGGEARAQKGIEPQAQQRDPLLEQDALRNLAVSQHYFTTKKAYKAVLLRTEEIIAAHPDFSRMDEVLYLIGMSNFYLSEGKGKQKITSAADKEKFAPEKLREDAVANLSLLV